MKITESMIHACLREDPRAQFELYKACHGFILGICYRYANNKQDAEYLLNTSYIKILDTLKQYNVEKSWEAWIRTVTVRVCIDEFRKQKSYKSRVAYNIDATEIEYSNYADVNQYIEKMNVEYIYNAIHQLPEMSRKVFNLFVIDGYSHREISTLLHITEGTSKWHVSNARNCLRQMLSNKIIDTSGQAINYDSLVIFVLLNLYSSL